MKCEICQENLANDAMFCPKCGERRQAAGAISTSPVSPGVEKLRQGLESKMIDPRSDEAEIVLWQGSYSPKAMMGGWLLSLVVTIIAFVAGAFFPPVGWFVAGAIALAFWGGHLVLLIYQRMSHEYKLTNQRFIHASGILRRVTDRIEVIDIDDVQVTQGFVERFLGVGTIRLLSSDVSTPLTTLVGIDEVTKISTLIDDTRRAERRKRSVHIEAV
jgi:membrane protein YdbS with pleckstrin-like domain